MTNNINININKAVLAWSTEGVSLCTGVNLEHATFTIDSIDKDGYVVMWCNPLRNRFYVYPQNLITNMKELTVQFPESWKRCTTIHISFRTRELYDMFCSPEPALSWEMGWRQDNRKAATEALNAMLDEAEAIECVGLISFNVKLSIKVTDAEDSGVDIFRTYNRTVQNGEFDDFSEMHDVIEDPKAPGDVQLSLAMDDLLTALGALEALLEGSEGMDDDAIANHYSNDTVKEVRRAYSALNAVYLND